VPGVIGLAGILVSKLSAGMPIPIAVVTTCVVAGLIGGLTGLVVTRVGITPLVTTLAMNALLVGVIQSYSGDVPVGAPDGLSNFALDRTLGLPNTAATAVAVIAGVAVITRRTVAGRRYVAVGENPEAAFVVGVRVMRYQLGTYVVAAVLYSVAGMLLAGYVQTAVPGAGDSYLLPVIAAVVVGGTPFSGGRGSVVATAVAALFLTQLLQLVLSMGAPTSTQLLIQSGAIALATALRSIRWTRLTSRRGERSTGGRLP
jgi:ribose transport system permease protein